MNNNMDFLKSDFEQCHQWMRHYDQSFFSIISFLYSGYAAIITAAYFLYANYPTSIEASIGSTILLFFASFVSPIFLYWMMRNRLYFTKVTRWVNEIRGAYLKETVLGIENKAEMYSDPNYPPFFNRSSTHSLFLYFTALCSSFFMALAISSVLRTISLNLQTKYQFPFILACIVSVACFTSYLLWIVYYFDSKEVKQ